jgi:hypothetical protein
MALIIDPSIIITKNFKLREEVCLADRWSMGLHVENELSRTD